MNKEQLKTDLESKGYVIQPVADWIKVSDVAGVVKYDLNVVDENDNFFTAQIKVTNDGQAQEEATPLNALKEKPEGFVQRLNTFLRGKEDEIPTVFAIATIQTYETDGVAVVKAFNTDNTTQDYVVRERNDVFEFQQTN